MFFENASFDETCFVPRISVSLQIRLFSIWKPPSRHLRHSPSVVPLACTEALSCQGMRPRLGFVGSLLGSRLRPTPLSPGLMGAHLNKGCGSVLQSSLTLPWKSSYQRQAIKGKRFKLHSLASDRSYLVFTNVTKLSASLKINPGEHVGLPPWTRYRISSRGWELKIQSLVGIKYFNKTQVILWTREPLV